MKKKLLLVFLSIATHTALFAMENDKELIDKKNNANEQQEVVELIQTLNRRLAQLLQELKVTKNIYAELSEEDYEEKMEYIGNEITKITNQRTEAEKLLRQLNGEEKALE